MCHSFNDGNSNNPCFQYQDGTQTWHVGPHPINNVSYSASVLMRNDEVWWITGGRINDTSDYIAATEILDSTNPGIMTFETFDRLPIRASAHNVVAINDTSVFFLDGAAISGEELVRCWIYDLNTGTWNRMEDMPVSKWLPAAGYAESSDGARRFIVVTGGNNDQSTWMFDLHGEFWKPGNDIPTENARSMTSVPFKGTTFLLVGGGWSDPSDQIFEFEPDAETLIERPERLKTGKDQTAAFMIPDDYATC